MKIHIELELTPRVRRLIKLAIGLSVPVILTAASVAYAQTNAATTNDTLIGSALNALGNAVTVLQVQVAQLQAADRVNRVTLSQTGAVVSENGRWLARVDHPATGSYLFSFATGAFASPPTCVAGAVATDATFGNVPGATPPPLASIVCAPATATSMICQARADRTSVDTPLSVLCVGL